MVSAGATGAFYCACLALLNPGDEVILFEPYLRLPRQHPGGDRGGARLRADAAAGLDLSSGGSGSGSCTPRTRGIMVNTPANPSRQGFHAGGAGDRLPALPPGTTCSSSPTRSTNISSTTAGSTSRPPPCRAWRSGPSPSPACPRPSASPAGGSGIASAMPAGAQTIGYFNDLVYVCAPAPLQMGVARGLSDPGGGLLPGAGAGISGVKREMICTALDRAGLTPFVPGGGLLCAGRHLAASGDRTARKGPCICCTRPGWPVFPGEAFYHDDAGEGLARFCFAKEDPVLDEACRRLERLKL